MTRQRAREEIAAWLADQERRRANDGNVEIIAVFVVAVIVEIIWCIALFYGIGRALA